MGIDWEQILKAEDAELRDRYDAWLSRCYEDDDELYTHTTVQYIGESDEEFQFHMEKADALARKKGIYKSRNLVPYYRKPEDLKTREAVKEQLERIFDVKLGWVESPRPLLTQAGEGQIVAEEFLPYLGLEETGQVVAEDELGRIVFLSGRDAWRITQKHDHGGACYYSSAKDTWGDGMIFYEPPGEDPWVAFQYPYCRPGRYGNWTTERDDTLMPVRVYDADGGLGYWYRIVDEDGRIVLWRNWRYWSRDRRFIVSDPRGREWNRCQESDVTWVFSRIEHMGKMSLLALEAWFDEHRIWMRTELDSF